MSFLVLFLALLGLVFLLVLFLMRKILLPLAVYFAAYWIDKIRGRDVSG